MKSHTSAFTLIELSIVLVIIGLIVGGVLVGQDLIKAAGVRSQISQIERLNSAVNTFRGKFNALPGDISNADAQRFGFTARGQYGGQGDGNGVLEGVIANAPGLNGGATLAGGETAMFWVDLSYANGMNVNLIDGTFRTATPLAPPAYDIPETMLYQFLPPAKIGGGNYISAFSFGNGVQPSGLNFFGISKIQGMSASGVYIPAATPGITVRAAFNMDKKMDDGFPQAGNVQALYVTGGGGNYHWAAGGGTDGANENGNYPTTLATPGSSITCYDNGNVGGGSQQYSIAQNNGNGVNCALSFKFQ